jgi:hypothetical protein
VDKFDTEMEADAVLAPLAANATALPRATLPLLASKKVSVPGMGGLLPDRVEVTVPVMVVVVPKLAGPPCCVGACSVVEVPALGETRFNPGDVEPV